MDELERQIYSAISRFEFEKLNYMALAKNFSIIKPNSIQAAGLEEQAKKMVNAFQDAVMLVTTKHTD